MEQQSSLLLFVIYVHYAFSSIEHYIKISMKRCTAVLKWLTNANGDFQCAGKGSCNESAVQQSLNADCSANTADQAIG